MKKIDCDWCEGTGEVFEGTCCGDDYVVMEDLCPTCYEHQGDLDNIPCDNCGGTGQIDVPETAEEERKMEEEKIQRRKESRERFERMIAQNTVKLS